jgi:2-polyprenyl-3-methyl-5-hydroxy-6-metoxy-1,4-benzoquinol methylase
MSTAVAEQIDPQVEARARQTLGVSDSAIYQMVAGFIKDRHLKGGVLVDVGCGEGQLWPHVSAWFSQYVGVDCVRYENFPVAGDFYRSNLDGEQTDLPDNFGDVVVAVETIEHVENPWAFMRHLVRMVKPGGLVIVTTPNQLSFLSLLTLTVKKRFASFQDVHYPAHLTALLEIDLKRIAYACGLTDMQLRFTEHGRIVLTPWHYPRFLSRLFPRLLSDNILLAGSKTI